MKKKLRNILAGFVLMSICFGATVIMDKNVYADVGGAESFDAGWNGYQYYQKYGDDTMFNTANNCITFANYEKRDGISPPTGYWQWGLRYVIRNTGYYIDIRTDAGASDVLKYSMYEYNGYEYYKYELELQRMIELYSKAYPSVDFSKYFNDVYVIDIIALMGVRKNNIYTCYDDLVEDGKGRLKSAKAAADGKSPYTNLYTNETDMRRAYREISGVQVKFDTWYNHSVKIAPGAPSTDRYGIRTSTPVISGISSDFLYKINDTSYYVKADVPLTLSFDSVTLIDGEVDANATYQPTRNALLSYINAHFPVVMTSVPVYHYLSSQKGAGVASSTYNASFPYGLSPTYDIKSYSQQRSGDMTTLTSRYTLSVPEIDVNDSKKWSDDTHKFYGNGAAVLDNITKSSKSPSYVRLIGDKTPPDIVSEASYGWYNTDVTLTFTAKDALSGLKSFELYESNGTTLLKKASVAGNSGSISHTFTREGASVYVLKAVDNVGNTFTRTITVRIDKTPPVIDEGVIPDVCDDAVELVFKSTDVHSGMSEFVLKNSAGSVISSGISLIRNTFTDKGVNTYILEAVDIAGNVSTKEITIVIKKATKKSYRVVGTH